MFGNCSSFCSVLSCLVLSCLAGGVWAQQPAASLQPTPSGPVVLDVVVRDKAGQPIAGLQESDFQLLDKGKPAQIRSFEALGAVTGHGDQARIILLIDAVNASFTAVSMARTQVEDFLRKDGGHLPAPVSIAYLTDDGIQETGQPSSDGVALAQLLHSQQGSLRDIRRSQGFYGAVDRVQISLKGMQTLIGHETQVPGRKLLIWVSPGWPVFDNPNVILSQQDQRGIFSSVVGLSHDLRAAQVTMSMVDPLGTFDAGSIRSFLWQNYLKPITKPTQAQPGDLALQVMATQSGGQALWGSNDVAAEIGQCAEDAKAWYRITIDPQPGTEANNWHPVEVKVDKPGLKVRTRDGYYAEP